jgi:hypothetical protein
MFGFETRQSLTSSPTEAKGTNRKKNCDKDDLPSFPETKQERIWLAKYQDLFSRVSFFPDYYFPQQSVEQ